MGLINWIFDIYQHTQIDKLRQETARAAASVRTGSGVDAARLEQALGELALSVKTVQRMMVGKGVWTSEPCGSQDLQQARFLGWTADFR